MAQMWMVLPGRYLVDATGEKSPLRVLDIDDQLASLKANVGSVVRVNVDDDDEDDALVEIVDEEPENEEYDWGDSSD